MRQAILPAILLSVLANSAYATDKPKQLVLISFDGAHDNRLWDRSRALGIRAGAHFTYFLSCTFFMSAADKAAYQAPGQKRARSNTGFALGEGEVQARLVHVWQAHLEGHEMANHACGHFDGKDWSKADWLSEFAVFDRTLKNAWKHNGMGELEPEGWADFVDTGIKGFRAPYLSIGKGLVPALKAHGFAYDASLVTLGAERPKEEGGLPRFGLPRIPEGPTGRPVIAMDYNLYVRHSGGLNAPSRADEFAARSLAAFRNAFEAEYQGDRKPLQIGFHFVEMNGGAYWQALETFVSDVCGKPDVACVSYSEALALMGNPVMAAKKADPSAF
jgi:peptidoglycan/xylan/chitin deacetylase (PgdA/CDA1 family)